MDNNICIVTGPIGSGKSYLCSLLNQYGFRILDLDNVSHKILSSDEGSIFLEKKFPNTFVNRDFNKELLAKEVFSDKAKLEILEEFIHPKVNEYMNKWKSELNSYGFIEISAPKDIYEGYKTIVLNSPKEQRIKRLINRGMEIEDINRRKAVERSLDYMGLEPNQNIRDIKIDKVFIGSCTNGRIEDLREVAKIVNGRKVKVDAMIVPGSGLVKEQAEQEGLDKIFINSGFEWREPGCSMCLAMNADKLKPEERCASTSNRNFEGRQGRGGRTHLVSPGMAAAAAIAGNLDDVRKYQS